MAREYSLVLAPDFWLLILSMTAFASNSSPARVYTVCTPTASFYTNILYFIISVNTFLRIFSCRTNQSALDSTVCIKISPFYGIYEQKLDRILPGWYTGLRECYPRSDNIYAVRNLPDGQVAQVPQGAWQIKSGILNSVNVICTVITFLPFAHAGRTSRASPAGGLANKDWRQDP